MRYAVFLFATLNDYVICCAAVSYCVCATVCSSALLCIVLPAVHSFVIQCAMFIIVLCSILLLCHVVLQYTKLYYCVLFNNIVFILQDCTPLCATAQILNHCTLFCITVSYSTLLCIVLYCCACICIMACYDALPCIALHRNMLF